MDPEPPSQTQTTWGGVQLQPGRRMPEHHQPCKQKASLDRDVSRLEPKAEAGSGQDSTEHSGAELLRCRFGWNSNPAQKPCSLSFAQQRRKSIPCTLRGIHPIAKTQVQLSKPIPEAPPKWRVPLIQPSSSIIKLKGKDMSSLI